MGRRLFVAISALLLAVSPAFAHGGGGGGGVHYTYIPVIIPGAAPVVVPPAKVGDYSQIHTVAIITAVGQTMILGRSGLLAKHSNIDISDMRIDDDVDKSLRQYLAPRYTIVDVPYDRAKLAAIPNGFLDTSTGPLHDYITSLPSKGVDAFVVIRPDGETGVAHTPGLSLDTDVPDRQKPTAYANFEIDIVDAKTGNVIGHALSRVSPRQGGAVLFAAMYAPTDLKISPDQTPTPKQREEIKVQFMKMLPDTIVATLRSLSLGITLPEPGARELVPLPENLRPKIKTVAVISAIGDTMTMDHRGAFFVHDQNAVSIADWNLDQEIENDVAAALDKRIALKPMTADRAKIAKLQFPLAKEAFSLPVDGLSPSTDIDEYVLIVKGKSGDDNSGVVMRHFTPVGSSSNTLYAYYAIALVDPKTLKFVYIKSAIASPAKPSQVVAAQMPDADWADDGKLTPEQVAAIHKQLSDLLSDSLPETMMSLGLTGSVPANALASIQMALTGNRAQPAPAPVPVPASSQTPAAAPN